MAIKTILTVATEGAPRDAVIALAQGIAQRKDAHLDVLCLGVDRTQTGYYYAGANAMILQETITRATQEAEALAQSIKDELKGSDIRWAVDHGVAQMADVGRQVGSRARFSDLVVMPKPYGEDRGPDIEAALEGALFDGRAPVLVVPDDFSASQSPKKVMVAWDESAEALNAVRMAMPYLEEADSVCVVVVDPPVHGPNRSDPGGPLSQFLARHGVRVEIDVLSKTMPRISDILQRHAEDSGADLIVMGAYGHSRFREAILGGATRDMLENAKVPLFMAH